MLNKEKGLRPKKLSFINRVKTVGYGIRYSPISDRSSVLFTASPSPPLPSFPLPSPPSPPSPSYNHVIVVFTRKMRPVRKF